MPYFVEVSGAASAPATAVLAVLEVEVGCWVTGVCILTCFFVIDFSPGVEVEPDEVEGTGALAAATTEDEAAAALVASSLLLSFFSLEVRILGFEVEVLEEAAVVEDSVTVVPATLVDFLSVMLEVVAVDELADVATISLLLLLLLFSGFEVLDFGGELILISILLMAVPEPDAFAASFPS